MELLMAQLVLLELTELVVALQVLQVLYQGSWN
jgi:hypothetical protein